LVAQLAKALREGLAGEMDEYPAHHDPDQAGQINRAFRIVVRTIMSTDALPSDAVGGVVTSTLNRIARQRLAEAGFDEDQAAVLLNLEDATRDDWTAFLILTSDEELRHVLREQ
jgi:hypothetical protein